MHIEFFDNLAWETDLAYLFKNDDDDDEYWLPKSEVKTNQLAKGWEVEIPEWLAIEKGLV